MNGMADNEDETFFDDDDFDDLNDTTLKELEHNAILSTQQQQQQKITQPGDPQNVGRPILRQLPGITSISRPLVQAQPNIRQSQALHPRLRNVFAEFQDELESDSFEFLGDDRVLTPVEEFPSFIHPNKPPGETTQREQWRIERFGKPPPPPQVQQHSNKNHTPHLSRYEPPIVGNGAFNGIQVPPGKQLPSRTSQQPSSSGTKPPDNDALLAEVEELRRDREKLSKELEEKQKEVWAKQGEVTVLREKKDTDSKVFDRQLSAMKRSMQDETSKQRMALEAMTAKNRQAAEQYQMLKHDLDEEAYRAKALEAKLKGKPVEKPLNPTATPQRKQNHSFRDGFDEDEVMVISPAKSTRKSKPPTPTAAVKRKRKPDQSPIKPLALQQTSPEVIRNKSESNTGRIVPVIRADKRTARHLKLIQNVLNYQPKGKDDRLIEILIGFAFPSDPKKSFSSVVLEATSRLSGPRLPTDLLEIFTTLWSRCLKEKYYDPIVNLLEASNFIIDLDLTLLDKPFLSSFLPTLEASVTVNAFIRFSHSPVYHANLGQFKPTPKSSLNPLIPTTPILALLYKLACLSTALSTSLPPASSLVNHFWRLLSTDFILLLLNPWQPLPDMTLAFSLLATSINPSTFGNICSDIAQQSKMESYIVERISYLLWETPRVDEGLPPPTQPQILTFRLAALDLLVQLGYHIGTTTLTHRGTLLLFHHQSAIARLTRFLYDCVAGLYNSPFNETTAPLHKECINVGTMLLHHLIYTLPQSAQQPSVSPPTPNLQPLQSLPPPDLILDLPSKLSSVNGGAHKFTIVLTRLAFSEGFVIDEGISDETVLMAREMLEEAVTPDEAEMLVEVVCGRGWEGRKRRRDGYEDDVRDGQAEDGERELISHRGGGGGGGQADGDEMVEI